MKPIKFEGADSVLKAPQGMEEQVIDLPYKRTFIKNGDPLFPDNEIPYITTCWELTDEEIGEIVKNKCIFLSYMGLSIPPMLPSVTDICGDNREN